MSTIELSLVGGLKMQVDATVFGDWAVHQGPRVVHTSRNRQRLAWQITHIPSGLAANCMETCGITKAEAMKVGRWLSRCTFPPVVDESFGRATHREICRALGYPDSHIAGVRDGDKP